MAPDELLPGHDELEDTAFGAGLPPLEDATEPELEGHDPVSEDAAEEILLDRQARNLPEGADAAGPLPSTIPAGEGPGTAAPIALDEDGSDVAYLPDVPVMTSTSVRARRAGDWEHELSAHAIAVELRRIEADVRAILEDRDPKRKRKLSGTHRWQELEEDILSWYGSGRFDDATLGRLRNLVNRRHYLFRHMGFLASTRPTWNS